MSTIGEFIQLIGHDATIEFIRAKGGTSFYFPLGITCNSQKRREELENIVGEEQSNKLINRYGGTMLYIPTCCQSVREERNRSINSERDILAQEGLSERALVSILAVRHGISDRQVWRILKQARVSEVMGVE